MSEAWGEVGPGSQRVGASFVINPKQGDDAMNEKKPEAKPIPTVPASEAILPANVRISGWDLLDPDDVTALDPRALTALTARSDFLDKAITLALRDTELDHFVIHQGENGKATVYTMGRAALKILQFFGLHFAVPVPVKGSDGQLLGYQPGPQECSWEMVEGMRGERPVQYVCVQSALWQKNGRCVALTEGKRLIGSGYSGDAVQARQCAVQNMASRAVRVLGLVGSTVEWFAAHGKTLDPKNTVSYQDRKSVTSTDPEAAVLPFGKEKGVTVASADTANLEWILPKIRESAEDPKRAKFKGANEALAKAIEAELAKRASKPSDDAEAKEAFDKAMAELREFASAAVDSGKAKKAEVDDWLASIKTLAQAEKALEKQRAKAKAAAAKETQEPGSDG